MAIRDHDRIRHWIMAIARIDYVPLSQVVDIVRAVCGDLEMSELTDVAMDTIGTLVGENLVVVGNPSGGFVAWDKGNAATLDHLERVLSARPRDWEFHAWLALTDDGMRFYDERLRPLDPPWR